MSRFFPLKLLFWLAWAGVACWLCCRGPWFSPGHIETSSSYSKLMISWLVMTLGVLFYVIFCARTLHAGSVHDQTDPQGKAYTDLINRRVITLGLVGGFSVALPALAFTIIGLVAAIPHFTAGLSANDVGYPPEVFEIKPMEKEASAYFIGVDISGSNIKSYEDHRVAQVCDMVSGLFSQDRDGARIIKAEDDFRPFVFAGTREILFYSEGGVFDKNSLSQKFCSELTARLCEGGRNTASTDIVSFLDYVRGWAESKRANFKQITILIFSDFMQDQPIGDHEKVESSVANFMSFIRQVDGVRLVGISMRGDEKVRTGIDVLPYLEKYGIGRDPDTRIWRELSLDTYLAGSPDARRAMLLFNVYREVRHPEPLYLKYQVEPTWKGIETRLKMPDNSDHRLVYLGLRASQDGDGALSKVKVAFMDNADPFVLGIGGVRNPGFGAYRRQGVPLPIRLDSKLDVSRSVECDLLIAVPASGTVHLVRLVMLPVVGEIAAKTLRWALRFLAVAIILFALGASGVPEVIHTWRAKREERRRHAIL